MTRKRVQKIMSLDEKNSNAHILKKYGRGTTSMITEEVTNDNFLIEEGYLNNYNKPIKCKTCGRKNILEIEVFLPKAVSFLELWEKGKNAFTGEMGFSMEYRCMDCDSCEAVVHNGSVHVMW